MLVSSPDSSSNAFLKAANAIDSRVATKRNPISARSPRAPTRQRAPSIGDAPRRDDRDAQRIDQLRNQRQRPTLPPPERAAPRNAPITVRLGPLRDDGVDASSFHSTVRHGGHHGDHLTPRRWHRPRGPGLGFRRQRQYRHVLVQDDLQRARHESGGTEGRAVTRGAQGSTVSVQGRLDGLDASSEGAAAAPAERRSAESHSSRRRSTVLERTLDRGAKLVGAEHEAGHDSEGAGAGHLGDQVRAGD